MTGLVEGICYMYNQLFFIEVDNIANHLPNKVFSNLLMDSKTLDKIF